MDFLATLNAVAGHWIAAHQRTDSSVSLRTLGRKVANNSKLFDRPGMTIATFQAARDFLAEPRNWPAALVPDEAAALLERLGCSVPDEARIVLASAA